MTPATMMRALLYPAHDRIELAELPRPTPGEGEVLLRVAACGLCGSELEGFKHRSPRRVPPLVLGHEFCGEVAELGPGVAGYRAGQKVVSNSLVPCGECVRCRRGDTHLCGRRQIFGMNRPGAFAQFVNVPARCLIPWPDGLPAEAACLAEPMANGVHVANLVRRHNPKTALVFGAGPIGLCCQQTLQTMLGAEVIISDLNEDRLAVAKELGARTIIPGRSQDPVKTVQDMTDGEGVDVVVDAVGAEATKRQSVAAARPGGAVCWIGLHENAVSINSYEITLPERTVYGSYASTQEEMQQALDLLAQRRVRTENWAEGFGLDRGVEAFNRMLAAKGRDIKAVICPNG